MKEKLKPKQFIKKYLFPHKYYSQKNKTIFQQKEQIRSLNFTQIEYDFKNSYADIYLQQLDDITLSDKKILKNSKSVNKDNKKIVDICTILEKCSIDEISKYLIKQGKSKKFPDITTME